MSRAGSAVFSGSRMFAADRRLQAARGAEASCFVRAKLCGHSGGGIGGIVVSVHV